MDGEAELRPRDEGVDADGLAQFVEYRPSTAAVSQDRIALSANSRWFCMIVPFLRPLFGRQTGYLFFSACRASKRFQKPSPL